MPGCILRIFTINHSNRPLPRLHFHRVGQQQKQRGRPDPTFHPNGALKIRGTLQNRLKAKQRAKNGKQRAKNNLSDDQMKLRRRYVAEQKAAKAEVLFTILASLYEDFKLRAATDC